MIRVFKSKEQDAHFYAAMGKYFANLDIAKELERQLYNKDKSIWYVDFDNETGEVRGFASLFDSGKYYFLDNLYVLAKFRGGGVAKNIVSQLVFDNQDTPIKCIANNPYALKIFKGLNFVEVGVNGKYKKLVKYKTGILPL